MGIMSKKPFFGKTFVCELYEIIYKSQPNFLEFVHISIYKFMSNFVKISLKLRPILLYKCYTDIQLTSQTDGHHNIELKKLNRSCTVYLMIAI